MTWPEHTGAVGQALRDERPVVDPTAQISSAVFNLARWQVGALGLMLPKAIILQEVRNANPPYEEKVRYAAATWVDGVLENLFPPYPWHTFIYIDAGKYRVQFPALVPGYSDTLEDLTISHAAACPVALDGNPADSLLRTTWQVTGNQVDVTIATDVGNPPPGSGDTPFFLAVW